MTSAIRAIDALAPINNQPTQSEDTAQIKRALLSIATGTDDKQWHVVRSQFADDILVHTDSETPSLNMPADRLIAWAQFTYSTVETVHKLTDFAVHFNTKTHDRAEAISYWRATHTSMQNPAEGSRLIHTRCHHQLVRTTEGWKVSQIQTTSLEAQRLQA